MYRQARKQGLLPKVSSLREYLLSARCNLLLKLSSISLNSALIYGA
jgi:hypothetical protein